MAISARANFPSHIPWMTIKAWIPGTRRLTNIWFFLQAKRKPKIRLFRYLRRLKLKIRAQNSSPDSTPGGGNNSKSRPALGSVARGRWTAQATGCGKRNSAPGTFSWRPLRPMKNSYFLAYHREIFRNTRPRRLCSFSFPFSRNSTGVRSGDLKDIHKFITI